MKARSVTAEQVCEGERMGVQLHKTAPRQCANTVGPRGLADETFEGVVD